MDVANGDFTILLLPGTLNRIGMPKEMEDVAKVTRYSLVLQAAAGLKRSSAYTHQSQRKDILLDQLD